MGEIFRLNILHIYIITFRKGMMKSVEISGLGISDIRLNQLHTKVLEELCTHLTHQLETWKDISRMLIIITRWVINSKKAVLQKNVFSKKNRAFVLARMNFKKSDKKIGVEKVAYLVCRKYELNSNTRSKSCLLSLPQMCISFC